jgi:hypothetical protein
MVESKKVNGTSFMMHIETIPIEPIWIGPKTSTGSFPFCTLTALDKNDGMHIHIYVSNIQKNAIVSFN